MTTRTGYPSVAYEAADALFAQDAEQEAAHLEFLDRFTRDPREANRVRWEAFRTGDERLHRIASEKVWLLTREARR